jgi:hypothetical protein
MGVVEFVSAHLLSFVGRHRVDEDSCKIRSERQNCLRAHAAGWRALSNIIFSLYKVNGRESADSYKVSKTLQE